MFRVNKCWTGRLLLFWRRDLPLLGQAKTCLNADFNHRHNFNTVVSIRCFYLLFSCFHTVEYFSTGRAFSLWHHSFQKKFQWRMKVYILWVGLKALLKAMWGGGVGANILSPVEPFFHMAGIYSTEQEWEKRRETYNGDYLHSFTLSFLITKS